MNSLMAGAWPQTGSSSLPSMTMGLEVGTARAPAARATRVSAATADGSTAKTKAKARRTVNKGQNAPGPVSNAGNTTSRRTAVVFGWRLLTEPGDHPGLLNVRGVRIDFQPPCPARFGPQRQIHFRQAIASADEHDDLVAGLVLLEPGREPIAANPDVVDREDFVFDAESRGRGRSVAPHAGHHDASLIVARAGTEPRACIAVVGGTEPQPEPLECLGVVQLAGAFGSRREERTGCP